MAMPNDNKSFQFTSLNRVAEFIKSMIVEGYPVAIQTVYSESPYEDSIDHFEVFVGEKGKRIKLFVEENDE